MRGKFSRDVNQISCVKTKDISIEKDNIIFEIKGVQYGNIKNQEILLDNDCFNERINGIFSTMLNTRSKYNPVPRKVIIYNNEKESKDILKEEDSTLFDIVEPKWDIDEVYLEAKDRERIKNSLAILKYKKILFEEWGIRGNNKSSRGICLNFYGPPGTGKSVCAEGIAKYLNKKLLVVNYSEVESKYVGETPKNIKNIFNLAKENDAVIVFNEADSFLGKRLTSVTQASDYGVNITRSVMLIELDNFDGVVIFTTNLLENYDEAFKRRILENIEFKMPDAIGRENIWEIMLTKNIPLDKGIDKAILANKFPGITGADIKDIIILAATKCLRENRVFIKLSDFEYSYKNILMRYKINTIEVKTEIISKEKYNEETRGKVYDC